MLTHWTHCVILEELISGQMCFYEHEQFKRKKFSEAPYCFICLQTRDKIEKMLRDWEITVIRTRTREHAIVVFFFVRFFRSPRSTGGHFCVTDVVESGR